MSANVCCAWCFLLTVVYFCCHCRWSVLYTGFLLQKNFVKWWVVCARSLWKHYAFRFTEWAMQSSVYTDSLIYHRSWKMIISLISLVNLTVALWPCTTLACWLLFMYKSYNHKYMHAYTALEGEDYTSILVNVCSITELECTDYWWCYTSMNVMAWIHVNSIKLGCI